MTPVNAQSYSKLADARPSDLPVRWLGRWVKALAYVHKERSPSARSCIPSHSKRRSRLTVQ